MRHDMSKESEHHEFENLPDGWRPFIIDDCKAAESNAGNEMFIFVLTDKETGQQGTVYAIATQGKRWFLKQILSACEIKASADGIYDWEIEDILGKEISGKVENTEEEWTDRKGETKTQNKPKVTQVKAIK